VIGAPGAGFGNVVSGNLGAGIRISAGSSGTLIQNNTIGLAADAKTALGNLGDGISLDDAPGTAIGGTSNGEGNVIAANQGSGIVTSNGGGGLLVQANFVGTDATGTLALGNQGCGIKLGSSSNTIGGTVAGAANVIEFNGTGQVGAGVQLAGNVNQDTILSNSIYANAGLGINFGSGPTPNHAPGTPGPNDYQNYPVLSGAQCDGNSTSIQGTLYGSPNASYLVQFFSSPTPDGSGHGQGQHLIGSMSVQTDAGGNASFTTSVGAVTGAGQYVSATATGASGDTSEFSVDVSVQGEINLVLTASGTPNPVLAGGQLTYALKVSNQGTIDAHNVVLTDQLPQGVSLNSITPSQGLVLPPMSNGSVTVELGLIRAGASATVTMVVTTGPSSVGQITNTASVSSQETNPDPTSESASVTTTVQTAADVSIAMTESPNPGLDGGNLTYTMTISNAGPEAAGSVAVRLPVASGAGLVSAIASAGLVSYSGGVVVAQLGNLGMGASATVTVVLQAQAPGQITETATATSNSADPNLSNNTSTVVTQVDPASDLGVQVTASDNPAATGQVFQYVVTIKNDGPDDATSVDVNDTLPAGVSFVSASTDQGVLPTFANSVVSASLSRLAAGATAKLTIVVNPTALPGSTLVDSASVSAATADPNPSNNTATLKIPIRGVSDLEVSAVAASGSLYAGQTLKYTITVTNHGPADEPDADLTSALPAGVTFDSASSTQGVAPAVQQGVLTADLGLLPANQSAVVTLVVTPGAGAVGTLTETFTVQGQDFDPELSNNTTQATATVAPSSDLSVAISPQAGPAIAGVKWTYILVVSNAGPSDATGVIATSLLPAGLELVSALSSQGTAPSDQGGTVSADLGSLAAGASATVTLAVQPTTAAALAGSVALFASVSGDQFDTNPANNRASLTVAVDPSVTLTMAMVASPPSVESGQTITFTATIQNTGTTPATGVVVTVPPAATLSYMSSTVSQGTTALVAGQLLAQLGNLNPGASATLACVEMATAAGTVSQTESVDAAEYNLDVAGAFASASAQVLGSPGTVQFGATSVAVVETGGVALLPVVRLYGALGSISVNYQTVAGNAAPGRDFVPTSGTLVFGPGQTTGTIQVPVLPDPYDNHDEYVNVVLSGPTGGARLGDENVAALHIEDVDPDFTPPQVAELTWAGSIKSISSLTLLFTAPMDPTYASSPSSYHLVNLASGAAIGIASVSYSDATRSVTVVPATPLPSGQFDQSQIIGTGPAAVRDIAGNLLDGAGTGTPGTNYTAWFGQGTRLQYSDGSGNLVTLRVKGAGYLEQVRDASGNGVVLDVIGMVPHRTTLNGSVRHRKGSSGQTQLGMIEGLGQFGDVRVLLKSPPFRVKQYPFQRRGKAVL
jgi:uncharacterized repeat protein (TIGR01451 family)